MTRQTRPIPCDHCDGTGWRKQYEVVEGDTESSTRVAYHRVCGHCLGTGTIHVDANPPFPPVPPFPPKAA